MALVSAEESQSPVVQAAQLVVVVLVSMWLIETVDALFLDEGLDQNGIIPRSWGGLPVQEVEDGL